MKKVLILIILFIAVLIINNLTRSIYSLWQKQDLVLGIEEQLKKEKQTNENLKKELERVNKEAFVEEEARNKLFMARPNEQLVLIPTGSLPLATPSPSPTPKPPNWQQWVGLFFD